MECSVNGDLQVNYNNIEKVYLIKILSRYIPLYRFNYFALTLCLLCYAKFKVSWEPFIEPWQFLLTLVREQEMTVLPNRSVSTNIVLKSTTQLNINITESLVEVYNILLSVFMSFSRNLLF